MESADEDLVCILCHFSNSLGPVDRRVMQHHLQYHHKITNLHALETFLTHKHKSQLADLDALVFNPLIAAASLPLITSVTSLVGPHDLDESVVQPDIIIISDSENEEPICQAPLIVTKLVPFQPLEKNLLEGDFAEGRKTKVVDEKYEALNCRVCAKRFKYRKSLLNHKRKYHLKKKSKPSSTSSSKKGETEEDPNEETENVIIETLTTAKGKTYSCGDIVWVKLRGYSKWPAIILPDPDGSCIHDPETKQVHVCFFDTNPKLKRAWVKENVIEQLPRNAPKPPPTKKKLSGSFQVAMSAQALAAQERIVLYLGKMMV